MSQIELYHGDCLETMDTLNKLGVKVDSVITDMPYGTTACKWDSVIPLSIMWECINKLVKDTGNIVLFSKQPFTTALNNSNLSMFRYELIWCKQQATNPLCAKKRIMPIHENISIFYKKFGTYNPQMVYGKSNYNGFKGDKSIGEVYGNNKSIHRNCQDGSRYPTSVLYYNNVRKAFHPTQKPLGLMEYLVRTYTNESDTVLDFTMGSGTTGVACKKLNRNFIGIELDNEYYNIAKERLEKCH